MSNRGCASELTEGVTLARGQPGAVAANVHPDVRLRPRAQREHTGPAGAMLVRDARETVTKTVAAAPSAGIQEVSSRHERIRGEEVGARAEDQSFLVAKALAIGESISVISRSVQRS